MNLKDIIDRVKTPEPWSEGEKIPWNDPGFSARMLEHHLTQEHDMASRRFELIDKHVEWINNVIGGKPLRILDLACGPGLYSSRFTALGHRCRGIDFGPASIKYAKEQAVKAGQSIEYVLEDIRTADYGSENDLVVFIYGEFNVFKKQDIKKIISKAYSSLKEGGVFIAEPNRYELVKSEGIAPASWYSSKGGLFSPEPHMCLMENFWDEVQNTATTRYYIIDEEGEVTRYASSMIAYTCEDVKEMLEEAGFRDIEFHESLTGETENIETNLEVFIAHK